MTERNELCIALIRVYDALIKGTGWRYLEAASSSQTIFYEGFSNLFVSFSIVDNTARLK